MEKRNVALCGEIPGKRKRKTEQDICERLKNSWKKIIKPIPVSSNYQMAEDWKGMMFDVSSRLGMRRWRRMTI